MARLCPDCTPPFCPFRRRAQYHYHCYYHYSHRCSYWRCRHRHHCLPTIGVVITILTIGRLLVFLMCLPDGRWASVLLCLPGVDPPSDPSKAFALPRRPAKPPTDACTVGFHNFNLRIFNLRVSNPNKLIVDVFLTRCRISMC